MKPIFFAALLLSFGLACYAQQPLCFSTNCPQTPATAFTPRQISPQLDYIFRPAPLLPLYQPVAPLKFSPSSQQFLPQSAPALQMGSGIPPVSAAASLPNTAAHGTNQTQIPDGQHGSAPSGTGFSSGAGGIGFAPPHR